MYVTSSRGSAYSPQAQSAAFGGAPRGSGGGGSANEPQLFGYDIFGKFAGGVYSASSTMADARDRQKFIRTVEIPEIKRRAKYEQWRRDLQARKVTGQQRNTFGAMGIDTTQDTAIEVLSESIKEMEIDNLMALRDSEMEVYAKQQESKLMKKAAKRQAGASIFGIFGS